MDLVKLRRVVKELEETKKMAVKCRKKLDAIKKSNGKWEVEMAACESQKASFSPFQLMDWKRSLAATSPNPSILVDEILSVVREGG